LEQFLYYLVRYVPNVATGQFANIGVLLHWPRAGFLDCLFADDFRDVQRLHPQADLEFLRELQPHFEQEIAEHERDVAGYVRAIHDSYSNVIQLSDPEPCAGDDPEATLSQLFGRYVGARAAGPPRADTRVRIKRRLAAAFEQHGVMDHRAFQRDVPAAQWTGVDDGFTFDFGYVPVHAGRDRGPDLKLIHALSLLRGSELAETVRSKFDKVVEALPARLVAAHEDVADPSNALVRSSQDALRGRYILLLPVASFDEFARWVRWELGM
jgi:hypothetical protein